MYGLMTIDDDSWLIGDRIVLARSQSGQPWPDDARGLISTWHASDGFHYAILETSNPPPASRPWVPTDSPVLVHIAGGNGARSGPILAGHDAQLANVTAKCVYYVVDAFIKIHHTLHCDSTDEHLTINELHQRLPNRTFALPRVLYHACYDNRYFLVTSKVRGETTERLWWDFDDATKNCYAELVAQACIEVAAITSTNLGTGVDGTAPEKGHSRQSLTREDGPDMLANCQKLNLDVKGPFHLFHEDKGPTNIIIEPHSRTIGIIDLQAAAFVPKQWIGTNFANAMNMVQEPPEGNQANDYAKRVWKALQRRGFGDDGGAWLKLKEVDWE